LVIELSGSRREYDQNIKYRRYQQPFCIRYKPAQEKNPGKPGFDHKGLLQIIW
jgi:hypothetical protein